jgi:hypothetical protein
MALSKIIKQDPYLKISNLTDLNDIDYALNRIRELSKIYGMNKILQSLYLKILVKRERLIYKNSSISFYDSHILNNIQGNC